LNLLVQFHLGSLQPLEEYFTFTSGPLEAFQAVEGKPQNTAAAVSDNLFVLYKRLKGARGRRSHVVPVK
jgi:hypothetical protein